MAEQKVRLVNKSAHVKNIGLGNGQVITVPPTEDGVPGTLVTFDNDTERAAFDRALASPAIKQWVDAGELVVTGGSGSAAPATSSPQTGAGAQTGATTQTGAGAQTSESTGRRGRDSKE